eukprot:GCRY01004120.1.p1 GENE.GCRY01004120.1~~GCRY01004120.1.p1  ORF type:complete len:159 (+),score=22.35 GCRY01004120.1:311-787(+)
MLSEEEELRLRQHLHGIRKGFKLQYVKLFDGHKGSVLWESVEWNNVDVFSSHLEAHVPKKIFKSKVVSREICFSSEKEIKNFNMTQVVTLDDVEIEEWDFDFGFVIPGSVNTWQIKQLAAAKNKRVNYKTASGKIFITTSFYDGEYLIAENRLQVFYI